MKLQIERQNFLKSWQIAEKVANIRSTKEALTAVLITASDDGTVTLESTDMKSYVKCKAEGVSILETGSALANASILGNMMRKYSTDEIELEFNRERGLLKADGSRTRVTGIPTEIFPNVPNSKDAELICEISASELARIISEGSSASSQPQDFPKYMGTSLMRTEEGIIKVISTDGRRLSVSKCYCSPNKIEEDLLLASPALKELGRTMSSYGEDKVSIMAESSMVWFILQDIEFAIRRIESNFPNYERILNDQKNTILRIDCNELSRALDRIDIIAKTTMAHIMAMALQPTGEIRITARAPELGTVSENLFAQVEGGYLQLGFNVGYFQDGLKALGPGEIVIEFSGEEEQTRMYRAGKDDFLYMLMPARLSQQDAMTEEEISDFRRNSQVQQDYQAPVQEEYNPESEYQEPSQEYNPEQAYQEPSQDYNSEQNYQEPSQEQYNPEQNNY